MTQAQASGTRQQTLAEMQAELAQMRAEAEAKDLRIAELESGKKAVKPRVLVRYAHVGKGEVARFGAGNAVTLPRIEFEVGEEGSDKPQHYWLRTSDFAVMLAHLPELADAAGVSIPEYEREGE